MTSHERSPTWGSEHDGDASAPEEGETERRSPSPPVGSRHSRRARPEAPRGASDTGVPGPLRSDGEPDGVWGGDGPFGECRASISETSSAWSLFRRQLMWVGLGTVAMFVTMRIDYRRWRVLAVPSLVGSTMLLVLVVIPGFESRRTVQPVGSDSAA